MTKSTLNVFLRCLGVTIPTASQNASNHLLNFHLLKLYKLGHPIEREILSIIHAHSQLSGVLSFKIGKNGITLTSYDTTHIITRILLLFTMWALKYKQFVMIGVLFLIFLVT